MGGGCEGRSVKHFTSNVEKIRNKYLWQGESGYVGVFADSNSYEFPNLFLSILIDYYNKIYII